MKDIFKPALILLLICFVTVSLVAVINYITHDEILARAAEARNKNMQAVLPDATTFDSEDIDYEDSQRNVSINEINIGYNGDEPAGYVYITDTNGYGGEITVVVGVGSKNKVTGVVIGDNNETPGLGKQATDPEFRNQFIGTGTSNLVVVKKESDSDNAIDALSGATITSNAVTNAVNAVMEYYIANQKGAE